MNRLLRSSSFRRIAAGTAIVATLLIHLTWVNMFSESDPAQDAWLTVPAAESIGWLDSYIAGEHYWMGYAYALSIGFAVYALLLFAATRMETTGRFAIGSIGLSGFLAVFGCFLVGCCGSPMLGVYLSLFGASFLPFAGPLIALITTILIAGSWFWLRKRTRCRPASDCC
jgi:hypothetical protein